jgi:sugar phosphate permease
MGPVLKTDLHLSNTQFGILCGTIGVGTTLSQIPAGMWCDKQGVRSVMTGAFVFIALLSFLFSMSAGFVLAGIVLLFLGIAVGCSQIAAAKAVLDWFPFEGRATAMGLKQTGINIGGMIGSVVLPLLLALYAWSLLFKAMGGLALLFGFAFWFFYSDATNMQKNISQTRGNLGNSFSSLKNTNFIFVTLAGVFLLVAQFAFSSYLMLYLNQVIHRSMKASGIVLALAFAVGAVGRVGWGIMSDYLIKSRERTLAIVAALGAVSIIVLAIVTPSIPLWVLYVLALFVGITVMGWQGIWFALVGELSRGKATGAGLGLALFFGNLGVLFGPPLFGLLTDISGSFSVAWFFLALCMGLSSFLMLAQTKISGAHRTENYES